MSTNGFDPRLNRICQLLGIEKPIIQGGMAWTATAELAAAASNAGALGVIGGGQMPTEMLRAEVRKTRELTDKPFAANIILLPPNGDGPEFVDAQVDMLIEERVPIVIIGAGDPRKYAQKFKDANIILIGIAPTGAIGKAMEDGGCAAVIGEGLEAGGHIGDLTTMVLIPQLVDSVSVPVIAAGGIGDRRGVEASFALGAEGVQVGTRFMCAEECTIHPDAKAKFIATKKHRATTVTGRSTGHPVRVVANKLSKTIDALDMENKPEEVAELGSGKLALAMRDGDTRMGSLMAGQIIYMVNEIEPAAKIVDDLAMGLPGNH